MATVLWGSLAGNFDANFGDGGSQPYPQPHWIKTYAQFLRGRFLADFVRDNTLTDGVCLKTPAGAHFLFYRESTQTIEMDLSGAAGPQPGVAVDTTKPYAEIDLGLLQSQRHEWAAPYASDWAIAIGDFHRDEGAPRSETTEKTSASNCCE